MAKLFINEKNRKGHINPEIYGHFSEHLGRCIYEGLYVGEDSEIPNVNGMRTDVVEALKEMKIPVLPGPAGSPSFPQADSRVRQEVVPTAMTRRPSLLAAFTRAAVSGGIV